MVMMMMMLAVQTLALGAAAGERGAITTLRTEQLAVTLDAHLPRPLTVLYRADGAAADVNFSAKVSLPGPPPLSASAAATPCPTLAPPFCGCAGGAGSH